MPVFTVFTVCHVVGVITAPVFTVFTVCYVVGVIMCLCSLCSLYAML